MPKNLLQATLTSTGIVSSIVVLLVATLSGAAQDKPEGEVIGFRPRPWVTLRPQAKTFHVTVNIELYSTPKDQKTLMDAFKPRIDCGIPQQTSSAWREYFDQER